MMMNNFFPKLFNRCLPLFPNVAAKRLIQYDQLYSSNSLSPVVPQSIFFFTTHKCASTFINKALQTIFARSKFNYLNYYSALWHLGDKITLGKEDLSNASLLFKAVGEVYGPLRIPLNLDVLKSSNNIFFLRDPRDILVSNFYSLGYSHSPPKNSIRYVNFEDNRRKLRDEGIDQYVLRASEEWVLPTYLNYQSIKESSSTSSFISYQTFFENFPLFLEQFQNSLDISFNSKTTRKLHSFAKMPISNTSSDYGEDIFSHHRSGKSHQYIEKLQPSTIRQLSSILSPVLDYWQFS